MCGRFTAHVECTAMVRMICLETDEGEVFVNLDSICQAIVTADKVAVEYANGTTHLFRDAASHAMIQALRHEEKRTQQIR